MRSGGLLINRMGRAPLLLLAVCAAAFLPMPVAGQGMGDGSVPKSLDSAVRFLGKMARDQMFGVIVYTDRGVFSFHGTVYAMEQPSTCTLRFLIKDSDRPAQRTLTRTIDFAVRREVYSEAYNLVSGGITVTGPIVMTDGSTEGAVNFGIDTPDLKDMSIAAFQYIIDSCSTKYRFD